ncbi:hypothetical protein LJB90_03465, partial [Eubacteriales bacterium OttesenSCG-928-G02]|nr:hypothetical protein [Eubacteriales bacterium OttesenSCG-928-G02]
RGRELAMAIKAYNISVFNYESNETMEWKEVTVALASSAIQAVRSIMYFKGGRNPYNQKEAGALFGTRNPKKGVKIFDFENLSYMAEEITELMDKEGLQ